VVGPEERSSISGLQDDERVVLRAKGIFNFFVARLLLHGGCKDFGTAGGEQSAEQKRGEGSPHLQGTSLLSERERAEQTRERVGHNRGDYRTRARTGRERVSKAETIEEREGTLVTQKWRNRGEIRPSSVSVVILAT